MNFKYRPDVDGLRAVAVLLVILFHAGLGFPGGYIGVDVFFVISGFLITGLILKEQAAEKFSLSNFWGRRIRRIVPAATAVGVICLLAGFVLLLPAELADLAESLIAQQTMVANIYFWMNTNYFDGPSETMVLLHCWSLAVEEQFYLGFPLLLMALKNVSRRTLATVFMAIAIASFALSAWGVHNFTSATFYLLPTRAWELLVGSLLACCSEPTRLAKIWKEVGSWIGMALIIATGWFYDDLTPFPGAYAAIPCLGTFMLIYFNSDELTSVGSILALKPLVFIGLLSYSWYLWHWPIMAFARYWFGLELDLTTAIASIVISFLISIASWKYVETPFRKGFAAAKTSSLVIGAVVSSLLVIGLCYFTMANHGFVGRYPENVLKLAQPIPSPKRYGSNVKELENREMKYLGQSSSADQKPDFLVWGDSHAMALGGALDEYCAESGLFGVLVGRRGTAPLLGVYRPNDPNDPALARKWNDEVLTYIRESEIKQVVLVCRWSVNLLGRPNGKLDMLLAEQGASEATIQTAKTAFSNGLERTLDALENAGVRTLVLKQVPLQSQSPQRSIVLSVLRGGELPSGIDIEEHEARQETANSIIDQQTSNRAGVSVIDPSVNFFGSDQRSKIGSEAGSFYCDENHLSDLGASELVLPLLKHWFKNNGPADRQSDQNSN